MSKDALFTMKLEPALREAFMQAARAEDRPASQILRELMREYIERRSRNEDYRAWLEGKVERARASMRSGRALDHDQVESEFAQLRGDAMKVAER